MDKKKSIQLIVGIVFVLAIIIQFARFDNLVVSNFQNASSVIDPKWIENEAITEKFNTDDQFLIIYNSTEEISAKIFENTESVLKQLKKQYRVENMTTSKDVYIKEKAVLIILEDLGKIRNLEALISYMQNGGKVAFLEVPHDNQKFYSIAQQLGIMDAKDKVVSNGISFDEKFMPGFKADYIETEAVNNASIQVALDSECDVYMTSEIGLPILWTRDSKAGRFLFFNGSMLQDKSMTGVITRCLALLNEEFIYPVINSKVIWLDDFPSPMSNTYFEEIKALYNKTIKEFYFDVWWPKMLELAQRYNIKYTGVMIQTYNDRTKEPFMPAIGEISSSELVALGRELIRSGGELGIHGYNHQSLTEEYWKSEELGYNKWENTEDMIRALRVLKEKVSEAFPEYEINAYVPPSNVIDENGIRALKTVFPEVDVIGSVYYEDYLNLSYSQNFEYTNNKIINLPRFSAGYNFSMNNRIAVLNGILAFGAVQHFIHPDDFMDPERNEGQPVEKQLENFEDFASFLNKNYSFIPAQTASEASVNVAKYIGLDYTVDYSELGITVNSNATAFPMYMFLHTQQKVIAESNCVIRNFGEHDYVIEFTDKNFSIKYKR